MNGRVRNAALAGAVAALLALTTSPAPAAPAGSSSQIGCWASAATGGCTTAPGITGGGQPAFSPDGRFLYVPGATDNTLTIFTRDGGGTLTRIGCVSATGADGCALLANLVNPRAAAVSPDGGFLYVVGDGRLFAFRRAGETLEPPACFTAVATLGCTTSPALARLAGANSVFARDDSVHVTSATSVLAFRREGATHAFSNCVGAAPCATDHGRFNSPTDVVVSPDGAHAYVSSYNTPDRLVSLDRSPDGVLSARSDPASCVSKAAQADCTQRPAGRETFGIALSPDGRQLYAGSRYQYGGGEAVEVFDLPGDGSIVARSGGCWSSAIAAPLPGCSQVQGLEGVADVAVAPDGLSVYAGSLDGIDNSGSSDDGYLVAFGRSPDGMLAPLPSPHGCLAAVARAGCGTLTAGPAVRDVVASPDSRHLYAIGVAGGGSTRLLGFRIEHAPSCAPAAATVPFNTTTQLQLGCSDVDGDAVAYEIVAAPQRGTLGGVSASGAVFYSPLNGLSGADSFTFRAVSGDLASAPVTASLDVAPVTGGQIVTPGPPARLNAAVRPIWARNAKYIILRRLQIAEIPAGAVVQVRCRGKRCPYTRRTLKVRKRLATTGKAFKRVRLLPGHAIEVRITQPGAIGKVVIYVLPRKGFPIGRVRCLPPGAVKPQAC